MYWLFSEITSHEKSKSQRHFLKTFLLGSIVRHYTLFQSSSTISFKYLRHVDLKTELIKTHWFSTDTFLYTIYTYKYIFLTETFECMLYTLYHRDIWDTICVFYFFILFYFQPISVPELHKRQCNLSRCAKYCKKILNIELGVGGVCEYTDEWNWLSSGKFRCILK